MSTTTDLTTLKINLLTEAQYAEAISQGTINANELYLTPTSGGSGGTVTSVRVQATSPVNSSTNTAQTSTLDTTISLANGYGDTKNPYGTKSANQVLAGPSSGNAAAPAFRALVAADIPDLSGTYLTLSNLPIASANSLGGIKVGTGLTIDAETGVLNATGTSITIDSALSSTSTNPVQNKVINSALSSKIETETDPVFAASAAYGISSSDITNWNGKTSNTGTVTSVRVQATSPVTSSTSTAQSSTLNTTISL